MVRIPHRSNEPRNVAVLYSLVDSLGRGEDGDLLPDLETADIAISVRAALVHSGFAVSGIPIRTVGDIAAALLPLDRESTLVFNLCEALDNSNTGGEILAAREIERNGFLYTGANPDVLERCLDKARSHAILAKAGIPVARYQVFEDSEEPLRLTFPVIVKPTREDCSLAISEDAVVDSEDALRKRIRYVLSTYRQPALVEQFLDGREFSVSVWGNSEPGVVGTGEIDFSSCPDPRKRIETFSNKWSDRFPGLYPARGNAFERRHLEKIGLEAYQALGCNGYGRVDLRKHGDSVYVLEVNPNPSLAADAGFARAAQASGMDYAAMARRLVLQAWSPKEHTYGTIR
jgi:D-alanine-D-alanine ligase